MSVKLSIKSVYSQQACFDMRYLYLCLDIRNILYDYQVSYAATNNYKNAKDPNYGILTIFYA
jgi:hypothetical protein